MAVEIAGRGGARQRRAHLQILLPSHIRADEDGARELLLQDPGIGLCRDREEALEPGLEEEPARAPQL